MNKYKLGVILALFAINNASAKFYVNTEVGILKSEKVKSDQSFYDHSGKKSFNSSQIYSLGFGYKINDKFRSELTYSYTDLKYSVHKDNIANNNVVPADFNQKVNIQAGMINLFYDVMTYQKLTPYLGIGVGYANINPKDAIRVTNGKEKTYVSKKSNNLSYSLMGGISFEMNDKVNLDIGYKFQDFGKASGFNKVESASGSTDVDPKKFKIKTHSATVGLRFNF